MNRHGKWIPKRSQNLAIPGFAERMTWGLGLVLTAIAIAIALLGLPEVGVLVIIATILAMLFVLTERDAVTILTILVVALMLVPSRFVIGALGAIGTPAQLVGLASMVWWLASRLNHRVGGDHGEQPLRPAMLAFTWWLLLSYGLVHLRQLDPIEASGADRRAIVTVALAGIALLAMDGIRSRERFELLLRRLVAAGGVMAILGLLQFFGTDLVVLMRLPGLELNGDLATIIGMRGGLPRVTSTAVHAIEFAVIMALLLPLAIHFALYGKTRRWVSFVWMVAILLALPVSVSRSSIVAVLVGLPILAIRWSWRFRFAFLALLTAGILVLNDFVPELFETLLSLFQETDQNASIQARIQDYERIYALVVERPWFGLGAGTFNPTVWFWVDNEWLMILTTAGIPGMVLLLLVFGVALGCLRGIKRRTYDPATRHLAQAFTAMLATYVVTFSLFDAFSFSINAGLFYLMLGSVGALWRLEVGQSSRGRDDAGRLVRLPRRRLERLERPSATAPAAVGARLA